MYKPVLVMNCACGSTICRGKVVNFIFLPPEIQARYIALGVVPAYITRRITESPLQLRRGFPAAELRGEGIC
jgi:hypothetical protein